MLNEFFLKIQQKKTIQDIIKKEQKLVKNKTEQENQKREDLLAKHII